MKKVSFLFVFLCFVFSIFSIPAEADDVGDLFNYYVKQLQSGKVNLTISEQPDSTGLFKDAYLDAKEAGSKAISLDLII